MSRPAICVENLGKRYIVDHERKARGGYRTLRESVMETVTKPFQRLVARRRMMDDGRRSNVDVQSTNDEGQRTNHEERPRHEEFWALRNVSFQVQPGEVVGIIGRNGAGKSTLLKILSRITKPTTGFAKLCGRVGSLLEVGTGFHPEMTGRENIYLSGSILGMRKLEIDRKFDRIVAFSEVEQFLDTPVKRYSSGMYVRLAFAVAAHLEPEILIIDEVLAVGDATFQKRCIDRISSLANSGSTVFLVSHNLETLPNLCRSALLLEKGVVARSGPTMDVIDYYIESQRRGFCDNLTSVSRIGDGRARFVRLQLLDTRGRQVNCHTSGEDLITRIEIDASQRINDAAIAVALRNARGVKLISSWTKEAGFHIDLQPGIQIVECRFHDVRLRPGHQFTVSLWMAGLDVIDYVEHAHAFQVIASAEYQHLSTSSDQGPVICPQSWLAMGSNECKSTRVTKTGIDVALD